MLKPRFISFEGPEGAGKSTVLATLARDWQAADKPVVVTREPGGNPIAEQIRDILKSDANTALDSRTEALLHAAARRQHLVETILPALSAGKVVVSDRFLDSSLAYQGGGRALGVASVAAMNQFATEGLMPTVTVYFDLPVAVGLARVHQQRPDKIDRLDKESLAFHERVRDTYLELAAQEPERIKVIDATAPLADVCTAVRQVLAPYMEDERDFS